MEIRRSADHKRMPWKNSGGVTVEIAIFPENASVDHFDWRISTATVANDGPFSVFPGIDRTLSVLEGNGIVLNVEGVETTLSHETAPFSFAADAQSAARLIDGTITDLNVMTRRGRSQHIVQRHDIDAELSLMASGHVVLAICTAGSLKLATPETITSLQALDCAIAENLEEAALHIEGQGTLYVVTINPA